MDTDEFTLLNHAHAHLAANEKLLKDIHFDTPQFLEVQSAVLEIHHANANRVDFDAEESPSNRPRSRGLIVTGKSHQSKSYCTERSLAQLRDMAEDGDGAIKTKIREIEAPSPATVRALLYRMAVAAGHPESRLLQTDEVYRRWQLAQTRSRIGVYSIDEFQRALENEAKQAWRKEEKFTLWNVLASVVDHAVAPAGLILVGHQWMIDHFNQAGERHDSIRNRFQIVRLRPLGQDGYQEVQGIVAEYCDALSVNFDFNEEMAHCLIHASNFAIGTLMKIAQRAVARAALDTPRVLTADHFAAVYFSKTDCEDAANPFLIRDWDNVDPTLYSAEKSTDRRPQLEADEDKPKTRNVRRK